MFAARAFRYRRQYPLLHQIGQDRRLTARPPVTFGSFRVINLTHNDRRMIGCESGVAGLPGGIRGMVRRAFDVSGQIRSEKFRGKSDQPGQAEGGSQSAGGKFKGKTGFAEFWAGHSGQRYLSSSATTRKAATARASGVHPNPGAVGNLITSSVGLSRSPNKLSARNCGPLSAQGRAIPLQAKRCRAPSREKSGSVRP